MAKRKVFKPAALNGGYSNFEDYIKGNMNQYKGGSFVEGVFGDPNNWIEADDDYIKRNNLGGFVQPESLEGLQSIFDKYNNNLPVAPPPPPNPLDPYQSQWKDKIDAILGDIQNRPDFQYDGKPVGPYNSDWQAKVDQLLQDMDNRPKFSFDAGKDPIWKALSDQAIVGGQRAMADTLAKATAITGGHLNSHSQAVGQQAYQGYLQQLSAHMPGVVQAAQSRYDREGQDMKDRLHLGLSMEGRDWDRYRQAVQDYDKGKHEAWEKYLYEGSQLRDQLGDLMAMEDRDYKKWFDAYRSALEEKHLKEEIAREEAHRAEEKRRWEEEHKLVVDKWEEDKNRYEQESQKDDERWETEKEWHDQARQDALNRPSYSGGGGYRGGGGRSEPEWHYDDSDIDYDAINEMTSGGDDWRSTDEYLQWQQTGRLPEDDFEEGYYNLVKHGASDDDLRNYVIDWVANRGISYERAYKVSGMFGG